MAKEESWNEAFAQDVAKMRDHLGLDPECTPCAVPGGIEALTEMAKGGNEALDLAPVEERLPSDTPMEVWLDRMREVVGTCDEDKGNCYMPSVVLAAVEEVIEEGGGLQAGEEEEAGSRHQAELAGAVGGEEFAV